MWREGFVSAGDHLYAVEASTGERLLRIDKNSGDWTAVAGAYHYNSDMLDDTGGRAFFGWLADVTSDGTNLWVADGVSIRKLSSAPALPKSQPPTWSWTVDVPRGDFVTVAGSGDTASIDGTGTAASFTHPQAVHVVDGQAYVADQGMIRKVDLETGAVSTVAGMSEAGHCAGTTVGGIDARQVPLRASEMTSDGTYLYWLDGCPGSMVRRLAFSNGAISSVAGFAVEYGDRTGITTGPDGDIYVANGGTVSRLDSVNGTLAPVLSLPRTDADEITIEAMTADGSVLWALAKKRCSDPDADLRQCAAIYRIDPIAGTATTLYESFLAWDVYRPVDAIVSAGDYLYAPTMLQQEEPGPDGWPVIRHALHRWKKATGEMNPVPRSLPDSPMPAFSGITTSGKDIYAVSADTRKLYRLDDADISLEEMQAFVDAVDIDTAVLNPTGDPYRDAFFGTLFKYFQWAHAAAVYSRATDAEPQNPGADIDADLAPLRSLLDPGNRYPLTRGIPTDAGGTGHPDLGDTT
jgi:hypothetical protein